VFLCSSYRGPNRKIRDKVSEYVTSGAPATFEWQKRFNDPKALTEYLHKKGFHVSIWVNPYAQKGTKWYDELLKNNALVKVNGVPAVEMPAFTVSGTKIGYNEIFDDVGAVDFTTYEQESSDLQGGDELPMEKFINSGDIRTSTHGQWGINA